MISAAKAPELVAAAQRHEEAEGNHQRQQRQHGKRAHQAEFLGQHGVDEVGLLLRQEIEVPLGALQEALAPQPARTERDLGLDDVVTRAERIALGVEEHVDALALIAVHHAVDDRRRHADGHGGRDKNP